MVCNGPGFCYVWDLLSHFVNQTVKTTTNIILSQDTTKNPHVIRSRVTGWLCSYAVPIALAKTYLLASFGF